MQLPRQQFLSTTCPLTSETQKSTEHSGHFKIILCIKTMRQLDVASGNELIWNQLTKESKIAKQTKILSNINLDYLLFPKVSSTLSFFSNFPKETSRGLSTQT